MGFSGPVAVLEKSRREEPLSSEGCEGFVGAGDVGCFFICWPLTGLPVGG